MAIDLKSIDDIEDKLKGKGYIPDKSIATSIFLSIKMEKPLLIEGPAGVGKTELGKVVSNVLHLPIIRLQCYEGLDETKSLYEWEYSKQLLYTQILRDKIGKVLLKTKSLKDAAEKIAKEDSIFFSTQFLIPRPLLKAINSDKKCVLLIDEIDRSDSEFEAFLLEILSDFQVSIPEIGTIKAKHIPVVILTSNNSREISDALRRRCLYLYIEFPSKEREIEIVKSRLPGISEKLVEDVVSFIQRVRKLDIKKKPSISETLDWAKTLLILNAKEVDENLIRDTMNVILK